VYHLAADMGGIGYIETHKLACTLSTEIDLAVARWAMDTKPGRLFYSSSACVYPQYRQVEAHVEPLAEWMAWPAEPEDGYGVQKLYTEELMRHLYNDAGVETRVARYHNVYGPHGSWDGGREKAPAALCRKIAQAKLIGRNYIEMWGDGEQTRSFLFIDDCVEGTLRLARSAVGPQPLNIGSEHLVTVNELARIIMKIADVDLEIVRVPGYLGVRGRTSDNTMVRGTLGWEPSITLEEGLAQTYAWVERQVRETLWNAEPRATG
jgi:nucleoside-diphosphate-sugar epimerase